MIASSKTRVKDLEAEYVGLWDGAAAAEKGEEEANKREMRLRNVVNEACCAKVSKD